MHEKLRETRAKRALEFGVLINAILKKETKVPRSFIRQLAKFKRKFIASSNDSILGPMIRQHLLVLDAMVEYVKAHNAGDEVGAKRRLNEATRLWNEGDTITYKIIEEVEKHGD